MCAASIPPALRRLEPIDLTDKPVWSLQDASRATTLSVRKLQQMIAAGEIPARKVGRRVLLNPAAVQAALFGANDAPSA